MDLQRKLNLKDKSTIPMHLAVLTLLSESKSSMAKTILGDIEELPDINQQIAYVTHIRKDVIPTIKPLQGELTMIYAIEQSLIGLKREFQSQSKATPKQGGNVTIQGSASLGDVCTQILSSFNIKLTSTRMDILSAILSKEGQEFTITEIYQRLKRRKGISKSAVIATVDLFRTRGLVTKTKTLQRGAERRPGRPETKFRASKNHI